MVNLILLVAMEAVLHVSAIRLHLPRPVVHPILRCPIARLVVHVEPTHAMATLQPVIFASTVSSSLERLTILPTLLPVTTTADMRAVRHVKLGKTQLSV